MLAFLYLILVFLLGDSICKRFLPFVSTPHRVATGFLAGLLLSTWLTYLAAAMFGETSYPMLAGNLIFAVVTVAAIYLLHRFPPTNKPETTIDKETTRFKRADWIVTGIFLVAAFLMTTGTFMMKDGNMHIANHQSSDFGSTASIMQSFALGHNFPTEYPHFTGDRIRYHFLFYFQAGNMEYLGLSPATSNNILSILTLLSMLILVMTLGAVLFASRTAGRIGAILFYFHGSLSYIPFYLAAGSLGAVWEKMGGMRDFLSSGFPYRGEDWGVWSQVVYLNQRHLASSIGIFLIAVVFLAIRHRERADAIAAARALGVPPLGGKAGDEEAPTPKGGTPNDDKSGEDTSDVEISEENTDTANETSTDESIAQFDTGKTDLTNETKDDSELVDASAVENETEGDSSGSLKERFEKRAKGDASVEKRIEPPAVVEAEPIDWIERLQPFVFAGLLLGLMPMWNGAVFAGAAGVLALMFILLPYRREMIAVAVTSAIIALPQVIFLKTGLAQPTGYSLWYFGYTLSEPTLYKLLVYLAFTFGFKWVLIGIALVFGTRLQRLMMLAFTALIVMATCFQFSEEVLANHKFFNVWLVLINVPVAFGLVKLWNLIPGPGVIAGRVLAVVLVFLICVGGVIDLFPIKHSFWVEYKFEGDPLVEWVKANTDPRSIFLSHRYVNHGILVAGRRLFYGHPYYAWGAGYPVGERDNVYRKMFESKDINDVFTMIKNNGIDYVAIDNTVRNGDFIKNHNEKIYQAYFPLVYTDTESKYDGLKIYAVPEKLRAPDPSVQMEPTPTPLPAPAVSAFTGGEGTGNGQFSRPRGIATDAKGNFYVADTGNARIQKFDVDGKFIAAIGKTGTAEGEIKEPNGIALDEAGNIYVTDAANHKLLKLDANGQALREWKGPEPGFYGPRDIVFGPDKKLYIVDQGRTRIVKFDPATEGFTSWGTAGDGEGQFKESTGIAIGENLVFVADLGNNRVQVFTFDGGFVRQWEVAIWGRYPWHYPDLAFDTQAKTLYATNGWKNEIVAFDVNGNFAEPSVIPTSPGKTENPSSIVFVTSNKKKVLLLLNTNSSNVSAFEIRSGQ